MRYGTDDSAGQDLIEAKRRETQRHVQLSLMDAGKLRLHLARLMADGGMTVDREVLLDMSRPRLVSEIMSWEFPRA